MHLCVAIDQVINHGRNFRKLLKQNGNNITKLLEFAGNSTEKQVILHSIKSKITQRMKIYQCFPRNSKMRMNKLLIE